MYTKEILASYTDFEEYFEALKDSNVGIKTVVIGDYEDAQAVQKDSTSDMYPLLFVHIPSFTTFNSGGNKNHFEVEFLVLAAMTDDRSLRRVQYNATRNIVHDIHVKLETDAQNGVFEFNGSLQCEPKTNISLGNCIGWMVQMELTTQGVGLDSDYRT